jgi:dTMP kinase
MGVLIAIEGISGVGKTTHSRFLRAWLKRRNIQTILLREPSNSVVGRAIKKIIVELNKSNTKRSVKFEAALFAIDRLIQCNRIILPALKRNKVVILDRSLYSSYAYQQARGLSKKIIDGFNKNVVKPRLVIILDASLEVAMERLKSKSTLHPEFDAIFDTKETLRKARKYYLEFARKDPKKFKIVNTEKPIGEVKKEIQQLVYSYLVKQGLMEKAQ